ncbi:MAG: PQQ-dependent sugar dehydrogenase [Mobilitalea sp.]
MDQNSGGTIKLNVCSQNMIEIERNLNPSDINISEGYAIEVFSYGLDSPISLLFTEAGDMIIAESGLISGKPRVLRLVGDHFEVIAEDIFSSPITGINSLSEIIYVSHKGYVSIINQDGKIQNIIAGLPSNGDYYNSRVVFGSDRKLYFGQGTATNSGVVGVDNDWVFTYPLSCDYPGDYIMLNGQNFASYNMLSIGGQDETLYTGAYSPFGVPNGPYEVRKGLVKASGSILRANLDGSELELFAWGYRNPSYMRFDEANRLFVTNNGYEVRGSRPIANAPDEFYMVSPGLWYGWPDYSGGEPVTLGKFKPEGKVQPEFLLRQHPNPPIIPTATFPAGSGIMGFDFNYNQDFGPYGDVYVAEFGIRYTDTIDEAMQKASIGHRISRIDMSNGTVSTFAINKSGYPASLTRDGGFERPADVVFGPDGAMYILDLGLNVRNQPDVFVPNTGVIWKITKT